MASNMIQEEGRYLEWVVASKTSGDPVLNGTMTGVAVTDSNATTNKVSVDLGGVYDLSVKAVNDAGNSAVVIGDHIFYVTGDTPLLSKKASGVFFGYALEAVTTGATSTINVLQIAGPGPGTADVPTGSISTAKLADDAVTLDKLVNITRGSIIVGGVSLAPTELAAKTSGQILVGDGTDLKSVAVSGDITMTSAGLTAIGADKVKQTMLDRDFIFEEFESNIVPSLLGGGVPTGATGTTNVFQTEENTFEYFILGAGQTLLAPTIAADGLLCSLDLTADEGVEYSNGITARSRAAFVIGTSPAFYGKCTLKVADVSGSDICAFGFRKTQAYQAVFADYTDKATLNKIAGAINIETALNNNADTTTDTTNTWADAATKTLGVYVSAAGVVTYTIDGVAPTTTAAFTFDTGDVVAPFLHILHDVTTPGAIHLTAWEIGLQ